MDDLADFARAVMLIEFGLEHLNGLKMLARIEFDQSL